MNNISHSELGLTFVDKGRPPDEEHTKTIGPTLSKKLITETLETVGGRQERQDFTASSRRIIFLARYLKENPQDVPIFMRYARISPEELKSVASHLETHPDLHGELRIILDGMGGYIGGAMAAEVGTMFMIYYYHLLIARKSNQINAFKEAISQTNRLLYNLRQSYPEKIGMATFVANLCGENGHNVASAGDCRARLFENGNQVWVSTSHRAYENKVYSGLGIDPSIPKLEYTNLGHLKPGQVLILHSDGVDIPPDTMGSILTTSRSPKEAARTIANLSTGSQDNIAIRIIYCTNENIPGRAPQVARSPQARPSAQPFSNDARKEPPRPSPKTKPASSATEIARLGRPSILQKPPAENQQDYRPWENWLTIQEMNERDLFTSPSGPSISARICRGSVLVRDPKSSQEQSVPKKLLIICFTQWKQRLKNDPQAQLVIPTPWGSAVIDGHSLKRAGLFQ